MPILLKYNKQFFNILLATLKMIGDDEAITQIP